MPDPPRSAQTRERILDAARDLFSRHGADAVTVREVAKEAGITHPLVNRYFGSKHALLEAVVMREVERFADRAQEFLSRPGERGAVLGEYIHAFLEDPVGPGLIVRAEMDGLSPERMVARSKRSLGLLVDTIGAIQALVPTADLPDPRLVTAAIGAAMYGAVVMAPWITDATGLQDDDEFRLSLSRFLVTVGLLAIIPQSRLPAVPVRMPPGGASREA